MGDAAGVGPEVIARAWAELALWELARPFVIGQVKVMERALGLTGTQASVEPIANPEEAMPGPSVIPCMDVTGPDLSDLKPGRVDARAGRAAFEFLVTAIDLALAGRVDAITTLPLNKESLRAAGIAHPGHTEILGERCGAADQAMMLYLGPPGVLARGGLGVVHATLHVALRDVFRLLSRERIERTILFADQGMRPFTDGQPPTVAVAGLNPHAGENGLFGDEERTLIAPAVAQAQARGINVTGPLPADTLFARARRGEFDAVVAMYHDQGHVALKTLGFDQAVNVTLGLPIVRTSVAHGTAFDIAWQGHAETRGLIEAVRVAACIVRERSKHPRDTSCMPGQAAKRSPNVSD
jgi:4-hydroxythreonine-4-phosphate dehydrogenase